MEFKETAEKKSLEYLSIWVLKRRTPLSEDLMIYSMHHSRHTTVLKEDILKHEELTILAESDEAGVFIVMAQDGKQFFIMGHPEYDRVSLDQEYKRDISKGIAIDLPVNYYPADSTENRPNLTWRAHANAMYTNWLNYYVYQVTPYIL